jgi:electron transfer flavoprotein beta subunit
LLFLKPNLLAGGEMNIVTCFKFTPDSKDIEVKGDGSISLEKAEWTIGEYDLHAVEAAVKLVETVTGKVTALSAGPQKISNSKLKKDILSRGPNDLTLVVDEKLGTNDTHMTAAVLAAAVKKLAQVDLVICGEGSSDLYFQQVGLQLGEMLDWPTINAVGKIEAKDGKVIVERNLEDEIEVLEVTLPAVLSVTTDINQSRLPTMKEILKAGQKPVTEWKLTDLGMADVKAGVEILSVKAPRQVDRKKVLIEAKAEEAVQTLVGYLSKEGVI